MRRALSVFIAVCLVLSLFTDLFVPVPSARADTEGVWIYAVAGGKATITAYTGLGGAVLIPASLGTSPAYPVTTLGNGAFNNTQGHLLTSVIIPNSVTSIGSYAFYGCVGLTSVTIGSGVTSVGSAAFENCSALTSVSLPNGVTNIGNYAFHGCVALTSATIPDSVSTLGQGAFEGCTGLTSVTIGSGVTSIGNNAFRGCAALTSVTIPSGVTSIGEYTFHGCAALTSVTIPSGVTSIGAQAFYGCAGLTSLTIPNGVTSIGASAFSTCTGLTGVTIGNGVTTIGDYAFGWCTKLVAAYFLGNAPTMGTGVFESCASGFTVRCVSGTTGWTNPWYGYSTATFIPPTYTLTANVTGPGTVTKAPDASSYTLGTDVTLTASANLGYMFTSWSGDFTGTTNPVTITMDANKTVTATFSAALVLSASWNLISVPVPLPVVSIPGLQAVYGYHDGWSVPTTLLRGEAYWVQVLNAVTVPLPGTSATAPVPLTYQAGWQLLGNPFDVPLPMSSITNQALITTCYSYGSAWGVLNPATDSLQPGKGYWILLSASTTLTLTRP